jgi:hypothetical protein
LSAPGLSLSQRLVSGPDVRVELGRGLIDRRPDLWRHLKLFLQLPLGRILLGDHIVRNLEVVCTNLVVSRWRQVEAPTIWINHWSRSCGMACRWAGPPASTGKMDAAVAVMRSERRSARRLRRVLVRGMAPADSAHAASQERTASMGEPVSDDELKKP